MQLFSLYDLYFYVEIALCNVNQAPYSNNHINKQINIYKCGTLMYCISI